MTAKGKKGKQERAQIEADLAPIEALPAPGQTGAADLKKPKVKKSKKEEAKEVAPAAAESDVPHIPAVVSNLDGIPTHVRREMKRLERRVRQGKRRLSRGIDVRKQPDGVTVSERAVVEKLSTILKEMAKTRSLWPAVA